MRMIPFLMSTNKHRPKHWRAIIPAMGRHLLRNREDQIAHGNGRNAISGRVPITPMLKLSFICVDLAELNNRAGITSLPPRHYNSKRGNMYGDWMYQHSWSTHKGTIINTTLLCPLLSAAAVLVKPKLWRCLASSFYTCMRNIRQPITQPTTPSFLHTTSKVWFATPSKLRRWTPRLSWSRNV